MPEHEIAGESACVKPLSGAEPLPRRVQPTRALVLGGGGSTGNAWLIGVTAGLFDAGVDVTTADVTIGTSAGATAAAQLAGATPTELLAVILNAVPQHGAVPIATGRDRRQAGPVLNHLERTRAVIASAVDAADMRRRMGAAALDTDAASDGTWTAQWRAIVASRLPDHRWPKRRVLITAVDAHGGVLVLSPFGGRTLHPLSWRMQLAAQLDELRAAGSRAETVFPESSSEHLFGANAMDVSLRPSAARVGYEQGIALAQALSDFWC